MRSNAVEDSLGLIEGKVKHAFREIDNEALPLDDPTKVILAEFVGQQMARGLTYRELHAAGISQGEARLRSRAARRKRAATRLLPGPNEAVLA